LKNPAMYGPHPGTSNDPMLRQEETTLKKSDQARHSTRQFHHSQRMVETPMSGSGNPAPPLLTVEQPGRSWSVSRRLAQVRQRAESRVSQKRSNGSSTTANPETPTASAWSDRRGQDPARPPDQRPLRGQMS